MKLKLMLGDKAMLQKQRDESFKYLIDLNVERRKMLMALGSYTDVMGMAYSSKVEQNQPRMDMHDAIENSIQLMSTKPYGVPQKGKSICDPRGREEAEYRLKLLLKELDIK